MSITIDQLATTRAAAAIADANALPVSQSAVTKGATFSQVWTWIVAKITANATAVGTALGLATVATSGSASDLVAGSLAAAHGGTGQTSYTTGDILYASTSSALSKLADAATGNALISGGLGVAPAWGKVTLTAHVSGVLPVANGGAYIGATTHGDANVTLTSADAPLTILAAGLTAARTWTLPLANTMQVGARLTVQDGGGIGGANTLTVQKQGSDTLSGFGVTSNTYVMSNTSGSTTYQTNGVASWYLVGKV